MYVNELDGQLRAAHLILGYTPISRAFQAPKCVIRAKDPRLHRISVAYEGFVVPKGIPLPKYSPLSQPLPIATLAAGETSLPLILQVEEEEEAEQEEEGFVDLTEFTDDFEVFNQLSPPTNVPEEMGIQRKPQKSLQELLESQSGGEKLGSLLSLSFLLLHPSLPLVLLSHLFPPRLNMLTLRGGRNQRVRRQWRQEELVPPMKKRLTGRQSSRKLVMPPAEERRGKIFNSQSPKHGFQLPCLVVSP